MKLGQSNSNLRSPDCYSVRSYLIATVHTYYLLISISFFLMIECTVLVLVSLRDVLSTFSLLRYFSVHRLKQTQNKKYIKIMLEPIRTQNLGSLSMKLSQSNFNLWSPDCYLVRSYLIATVKEIQFLKNTILFWTSGLL